MLKYMRYKPRLCCVFCRPYGWLRTRIIRTYASGMLNDNHSTRDRKTWRGLLITFICHFLFYESLPKCSKRDTLFRVYGGEIDVVRSVWIIISLNYTFIFLVLSAKYWKKTFLPNAAFICRWTGSPLVYIMAFICFGAKPLSKPMMISHQSHPRNRLWWKK